MNEIKNEQDRKEYFELFKRVGDAKFLEYLSDDLNKKQKLFSKEARSIIKRIIKETNKGYRWKDFDTVVERLNAPELVDYYINDNITYKYAKGSTNSPEYVFSKRLGDCDDLAGFGDRPLSKAGYNTFGRRVYNGPGDAHI